MVLKVSTDLAHALKLYCYFNNTWLLLYNLVVLPASVQFGSFAMEENHIYVHSKLQVQC